MRIAEFIRSDPELILERWRKLIAAELPDDEQMNERPGVARILDSLAIILDSREHDEAERKDSGNSGAEPCATAADEHAMQMARSGFNIKQLAADYRALRASVVSLWVACDSPGERLVEDIVRFNEVLDECSTEAIARFHTEIERCRNLMLGMLGHDMRSPLATIRITAMHLAKLNAGELVSKDAQSLIRGGARLQALVDDLVDFNRSNLGLGLTIMPDDVSLASICDGELEQIRTAHPDCSIDLSVHGDSKGHWDANRLRQVVCNLVENAIVHGMHGGHVRVALFGTDKDVNIEVANSGNAIQADTMPGVFEPLKRGLHATSDDSLGLGLYIVREIAKAHGGDAAVRSDARETVFTVRLPRHLAERSMEPVAGVAGESTSRRLPNEERHDA
jgi:signal transduction histidine kinase